MTGVMSARVRSTAYLGADHFEVTLALGADGPFWATETPIDADVQVRLDTSSSYISLVQGRVDSVRLDPIARTVQIEGRDYSGTLIDSVVSESFSNRTSSEIATLLAQSHGLNPVVSPTKAMVGRYYQDAHQAVVLDHFCGRASEWDVLCHLAQRENYDVFVTGTNLNFFPVTIASAYSTPIAPSDVLKLRLERLLPFAGNIQVTVKTWNSQTHTADVETASRTDGPASAPLSGPGDAIRHYVLVRPNLTPDVARQLAQRVLAELSTHGTSIELVMPGELGLMPRGFILLTDTGTDFDQPYRINEVDRRISSTRGFVQRIRASSVAS